MRKKTETVRTWEIKSYFYSLLKGLNATMYGALGCISCITFPVVWRVFDRFQTCYYSTLIYAWNFWSEQYTFFVNNVNAGI